MPYIFPTFHKETFPTKKFSGYKTGLFAVIRSFLSAPICPEFSVGMNISSLTSFQIATVKFFFLKFENIFRILHSNEFILFLCFI